MAILTHGKDMTLAPTVRPIIAHGGATLRKVVGQLAQSDFECVQLDATMPGVRPRDLSRSGRRDLAAMCSRLGMRTAGMDLFIPRDHFVEPAHQDRAVTSAVAAIELAADLGRLPVSIALPIKSMPDTVKDALAEAADAHGVTLAVHAEDQIEALIAWLDAVDQPVLGAALDPAALIAREHDPAQVAMRLSKHLRVTRLSDLTSDVTRCGVGEGELDVMAYRVAIDLAEARLGPVVLDVRNVTDPFAAAMRGKRAWDDAAFEI
jgi:sugar phosphate isomerase/epimerase